MRCKLKLHQELSDLLLPDLAQLLELAQHEVRGADAVVPHRVDPAAVATTVVLLGFVCAFLITGRARRRGDSQKLLGPDRGSAHHHAAPTASDLFGSPYRQLHSERAHRGVDCDDPTDHLSPKLRPLPPLQCAATMGSSDEAAQIVKGGGPSRRDAILGAGKPPRGGEDGEARRSSEGVTWGGASRGACSATLLADGVQRGDAVGHEQIPGSEKSGPNSNLTPARVFFWVYVTHPVWILLDQMNSKKPTLTLTLVSNL